MGEQASAARPNQTTAPVRPRRPGIEERRGRCAPARISSKPSFTFSSGYSRVTIASRSTEPELHSSSIFGMSARGFPDPYRVPTMRFSIVVRSIMLTATSFSAMRWMLATTNHPRLAVNFRARR